MAYIGNSPALDETVSSSQIVDLTVATADIAADAITGAKIADDAIDSEHYTDASIDLAHMSANSIDSNQYVDGSIDNAHLADDAVDSDEIAAGAIDLAHMSVNSIDSDQYVDGSIDMAHMSVNSIDSDQYVDGSIDAAHLASGVGGSWVKLQAENVTSNVSEVELDTGMSSTYEHYMITISNAAPDSAGTSFHVRFEVGGSYRGTPGHEEYIWHATYNYAPEASGYAFSQDVGSNIQLATTFGGDSGESGNVNIWFNSPAATDNFKHIYFHGSSCHSYSQIRWMTGNGMYNDQQNSQAAGLGALTGMRFYFASADVKMGYFALYGLSK